jgi:hypothetical protein
MHSVAAFVDAALHSKVVLVPNFIKYLSEMTLIERRAIKFDRNPTFYGFDGVFGRTLNNHRIIAHPTLKDTQYIYLGPIRKSWRALYRVPRDLGHGALPHDASKSLSYHAEGSFKKPQGNVFSRIVSCLCRSSKHVGDLTMPWSRRKGHCPKTTSSRKFGHNFMKDFCVMEHRRQLCPRRLGK